MTPSLIGKQYISITYNSSSKIEKVNGSITIDLGGVTLFGNKSEDFEDLIALCRRALELLNESYTPSL